MDSTELATKLAQYHGESYSWALNCCLRDHSEAETVLQTVYLKILEGKARYDGHAEFKTWLFAVIRNSAADARRWHFLNRLRLKTYGEQRTTSKTENYEEKLYQSQVHEMLRQLVTKLPRRQQEVLQLVFFHELSLSEAAKVMGISLGSAHTHYERGKNQLRQQMEQVKGFHESR